MIGEVQMHEVGDGIVVVALAGEHDLSTEGAVRAALVGAMASSESVVIDLGAAEFVDSRIVATILAAAEDARASDRELVVVAPPSGAFIGRTVHLLGLDQVLPVYASRADALAGVAGSGRQSCNPALQDGA
jgi:anti-anti-sigma factor